MMLKAFAIFSLSTMLLLVGNTPALAQHAWQPYFEECGVTGSITLYQAETSQWITSDATEMDRYSLPASTFKIPNSLIILEEGLVTNPDATIPWNQQIDSIKYGYRPDLYQPLSLRKAFYKSAVWFYLEMARQIPRERYKTWLAACGYGNGDLSFEEEDFWNFGPFGVTPRQQIQFLNGLHQETLPFSTETMRTFKEMMISERTDQYIIRSKTGWARNPGEHMGWWVGYLERPHDGTIWYFATRLYLPAGQDTRHFGACRKEITLSILQELGALD